MINFSLAFGFIIILVMGYFIGKFIENALELKKPKTKQKEIDQFKKKYIKNKKNLKYFVEQLSPSDMEKIIKASFKRLDFNWNEDGFFDEDSLKKVSSIWDAIDKMDNNK